MMNVYNHYINVIIQKLTLVVRFAFQVLKKDVKMAILCSIMYWITVMNFYGTI